MSSLTRTSSMSSFTRLLTDMLHLLRLPRFLHAQVWPNALLSYPLRGSCQGLCTLRAQPGRKEPGQGNQVSISEASCSRESKTWTVSSCFTFHASLLPSTRRLYMQDRFSSPPQTSPSYLFMPSALFFASISASESLQPCLGAPVHPQVSCADRVCQAGQQQQGVGAGGEPGALVGGRARQQGHAHGGERDPQVSYGQMVAGDDPCPSVLLGITAALSSILPCADCLCSLFKGVLDPSLQPLPTSVRHLSPHRLPAPLHLLLLHACLPVFLCNKQPF